MWLAPRVPDNRWRSIFQPGFPSTFGANKKNTKRKLNFRKPLFLIPFPCHLRLRCLCLCHPCFSLGSLPPRNNVIYSRVMLPPRDSGSLPLTNIICSGAFSPALEVSLRLSLVPKRWEEDKELLSWSWLFLGADFTSRFFTPCFLCSLHLTSCHRPPDHFLKSGPP